MNKLRLKAAEADFLTRYPKGFSDPEMLEIRMVSRSSMISVFEKPKYRDWIRGMTNDEQETFAYAFRDILHGDQEYGFNMMLGLLAPAKLAKWTLMTILPNYYAPLDEVFIKPTTVKGIIQYLELKDLVYKPTPTYAFYVKYRAQLIEMRNEVHESLRPYNAAFSGFLMMTTKAIS